MNSNGWKTKRQWLDIRHYTKKISRQEWGRPEGTSVCGNDGLRPVVEPGTLLHTYCVVQSPSWAANWFAASQEIPRISRNPKFHYRTHKPPPSRMWMFYREGLLAPRPTPQAGGPPLVGCPRLLIQFIRSYPSYRRLFLYPQPEDAPCRGDRDPLHGLYILWY